MLSPLTLTLVHLICLLLAVGSLAGDMGDGVNFTSTMPDGGWTTSTPPATATTTIESTLGEKNLAQAQLEVMHELSARRNESANELTERVLAKLNEMDAETRLRYQSWVEELRAQEELQIKRIQLARIRMTPPARHLLDYILQVQRSEKMSQEEKFKRLEELKQAMDGGVAMDITRKLIPVQSNSTDALRAAVEEHYDEAFIDLH